MKNRTFENIEVNGNKKGVEMFIQTLEEMLFYYSYESYKLPALNSHFLCLDLLSTAESIKEKELTEGNIIPLCEEFEYVIERDYALSLLFDTKVLLKKQDSTGRIISLTKMDTKAKGNQYPSIAKYINDVCITDFTYINVIISELEKLLFLDEYELNELNKIYMLTRALVSDLVNGGYSPEYIRYQTKIVFWGRKRENKN